MIIRVITFVSALCTALAVSASADAPLPLLAATPLVMKDGRTAQVSVRVIPFQPGGDTPDATADLDALAVELATDCFLTVQAVGHAETALIDGSDPVAAHRVSRARAARVQEALVAHGLPESGIAAFWDWRFAVREPRVTLWVFELQRGADCTGAPLDAAPAVVALVPRSGPTPAAEPPPTDSSPPDAPPLPSRPTAPAPLAEVEGTATASGLAPAAPALSPAPAGPVAEPGAADALPAAPVQPAARMARAAAAGAPLPSPAAPRATLGRRPAPAGPAAAIPAPSTVVEPAAGAADEPGVELVFDLNSSYLPPSAPGQLDRLVAQMARWRHWRVELTASVSAAEGTIPNRAEARRYNRWLAERRLDRVAEWLDRNAEIRALDLDRVYAQGDASRRVMVRATPLSRAG